MQLTFREFGIPILAGTVCHVVLYWLVSLATSSLFPNGAEGVANHWYFQISPWAGIAQALFPGFVCGLLATKRPMLCGAIAVFLGALVVSLAFEIQWSPPYSFRLVWLVLLLGLQAAPFGAAGAAAGFLTRGMLANSSSGHSK
jgi:hypothetical protein